MKVFNTNLCSFLEYSKQEMYKDALCDEITISSDFRTKSLYVSLIHCPLSRWNAIGKFYLKSLDSKFGQDFFLCYCSSTKGEIGNLKYKNVPFYNKAVDDWIEFRRLSNENGNSINIFGNHFITVRNNPLYFSSFTKSGIFFIQDVYDSEANTLKPQNEIISKLVYKRNWLAEFHMLRTALNQYSKHAKSHPAKKTQHIFFNKLELVNNKGIALTGKLKLKQIIEVFNTKSAILKCEEKWNKLFGNQININWDIMWSIIYRSKASPQAKQLQYYINHQVIFTELKLQQIKSSDGICTLCKKENESLTHLFYNCHCAKQVWYKLMPLMDNLAMNLMKREITHTESVALLGYQLLSKNAILLNTLIFETKWYIWKNRCNVKYGKKPSNHALLHKEIHKAVKENILSTKSESLIEKYKLHFDILQYS